ncbi:MAG: hypothetical protein MJB14_01765, partial [Spirochaetes bacterium]|nr:hypothetical protein [Spirochaetota bacterium]
GKGWKTDQQIVNQQQRDANFKLGKGLFTDAQIAKQKAKQQQKLNDQNTDWTDPNNKPKSLRQKWLAGQQKFDKNLKEFWSNADKKALNKKNQRLSAKKTNWLDPASTPETLLEKFNAFKQNSQFNRQMNKAVRKGYQEAKKQIRENQKFNKQFSYGAKAANNDVGSDVIDYDSIYLDNRTHQYHDLNNKYKMIKMKDAQKVISKYYHDLYDNTLHGHNVSKFMSDLANKQKHLPGLADTSLPGIEDVVEKLTTDLVNWSNDRQINDPELLEMKAAYDKNMYDYMLDFSNAIPKEVVDRDTMDKIFQAKIDQVEGRTGRGSLTRVRTIIDLNHQDIAHDLGLSGFTVPNSLVDWEKNNAVHARQKILQYERKLEDDPKNKTRATNDFLEETILPNQNELNLSLEEKDKLIKEFIDFKT